MSILESFSFRDHKYVQPFRSLKLLSSFICCRGKTFRDHRKDYNVTNCNLAGPAVMKDEIRAALQKMKLGKATGPDSLSVDLLEALGRL